MNLAALIRIVIRKSIPGLNIKGCPGLWSVETRTREIDIVNIYNSIYIKINFYLYLPFILMEETNYENRNGNRITAKDEACVGGS